LAETEAPHGMKRMTVLDRKIQVMASGACAMM
jgi:hypothetical protein